MTTCAVIVTLGENRNEPLECSRATMRVGKEVENFKFVRRAWLVAYDMWNNVEDRLGGVHNTRDSCLLVLTRD
jgi:hypothetical protein